MQNIDFIFPKEEADNISPFDLVYESSTECCKERVDLHTFDYSCLSCKSKNVPLVLSINLNFNTNESIQTVKEGNFGEIDNEVYHKLQHNPENYFNELCCSKCLQKKTTTPKLFISMSKCEHHLYFEGIKQLEHKNYPTPTSTQWHYHFHCRKCPLDIILFNERLHNALSFRNEEDSIFNSKAWNNNYSSCPIGTVEKLKKSKKRVLLKQEKTLEEAKRPRKRLGLRKRSNSPPLNRSPIQIEDKKEAILDSLDKSTTEETQFIEALEHHRYFVERTSSNVCEANESLLPNLNCHHPSPALETECYSILVQPSYKKIGKPIKSSNLPWSQKKVCHDCLDAIIPSKDSFESFYVFNSNGTRYSLQDNHSIEERDFHFDAQLILYEEFDE